MEVALSIKNLSAGYENKKVLENLSVDIEKNKITAIIGPSGCGKSTLLKSINRMIEEEHGGFVRGEIKLEDQDLFTIEKEKVRNKIGMVFQTPTPFPFSIYKNMTYALNYYGKYKKEELKRMVIEKLEQVGLYSEVRDVLDKSATKLSGGQQQRLCIARALTVNPELLMLDEPCSALDIKSSAHIEQLLTKLRKEYTIVIVTHNISQAKRIADKTIFMSEGQIIEYQDTKEFFVDPKNEIIKSFLLES